MRNYQCRPIFVALCLFIFVLAAGPAVAEKTPGERFCESAGVQGGLCVMVGCQDPQSAVALASSGKFLVHVLESDPAAVEAARAEFHKANVYGLASAEALPADGRLPYAENLVNVVIVGEKAAGRVSLGEIARVLRPEGFLFAQNIPAAAVAEAGLADGGQASGAWRSLKKPWPATMDVWAHPRHAADGNAVSQDQLVAPPRRVRWVAGPQQEVSNMVTAGGRSFFGGVLARDAFNGLRLWEQKLNASPARGGFGFRLATGGVQPIAAGPLLLVVTDKKLQALDAATGKTVREYPEAGTPTTVLLTDKTIVAADAKSIGCFDLETGRLCWKENAEQARYVITGEGRLCYVQGDPAQAASVRLVCRSLADGKPRWDLGEAPWLPKVRQLVHHRDVLVCEISTLNDNKEGNSIQVLSAEDGKPLWSRVYVPGSSHYKQARAMFVGDLLWVLEDRAVVALDPRTGEVRRSHKAGNTHCFPPVASARYLIAGEMHLTDLDSGALDIRPITKAACSRDAGVVPANGLLYTFPKHCICWPMLRDYAALAPERPGGTPPLDSVKFVAERGPAQLPQVADDPAQWPCYRHDAYRSGSTTAVGPKEPKIAWTANLGGRPEGTIADDWRQNYYVRGPVGPPVIAGGLAYVTRPDAHQVVALDLATGAVRWTFTANGRVDTAPTIHRGLCLFGCKSGYVYCLRADDGQMVWRLRAAPIDERIVAYGQLESPWPIPGSVLIVDGVAYFAAGRQPLADGGVLVFAVDPMTGNVRWVKPINSVPQTNFYASSGLEFDNFDLLHREGAGVAMSRWLIERDGKMTCDAKSGFARLGEAGGVMVPRGSWSYAPRNETERWAERPFLRPLNVFRGSTLYGCTQDRANLFRRDFHLDQGEMFNTQWFAGWDTYKAAGKGGDLWQNQRLAHGAAWNVAPFEDKKEMVAAMVLAENRLYLASAQGRLAVLDAQDGRTLAVSQCPPPAWDGLAVVAGRLVLSTQDGQVVCLADK